MEILYINHYAGGSKYGMEYRPFYLAREWVRAGHSVTVVAASQAHVRSRQPDMDGDFTEEWVDGVRFVWCQTPEYHGNGVGRVINIFAFLRRLYQHRRWLKGKPDVVIASSTYPLDIFPARHIARKYGARLIWEVHDLWPLSPIELGSMSRSHPFIMLLQYGENVACRVADAVVSMLPKADAHLLEHGMAREKFVYIPNGIVPEEWDVSTEGRLPEALETQLAEERRRGNFIVLYAGTHGVANALDSFVEAAGLCAAKAITFVMVGKGYDKARLEQKAAQLGLSNILFFDPVPKTSMSSLLSMADALYIGWQRQSIYRFGISPNKLFDYMMSAKPIVHAVEAANDPVLDSGSGISVPPESPEAIADAVAALRERGPEALQAMGAAGRAYVERYHLYPVLARRFEEVMSR